MCGRFAQSQTREDYLALLAEDIERDIPYDPEPIGRYNVAPGTKVLLLSERDEHLHLDPVFWGYAPGWWDKPPLINARVETAATSRMFKPLWQHGRAICFADGWFEWNVRFSETGKTVVRTTLFDWSREADEKIKYYSGKALYSGTFRWKESGQKAKRVVVRLGKVANVATVRVNGVACGTAWTAPYEVDVTEVLRKGTNTLDIEVVNTWANALRGADLGKAPFEGIWTNAKYRLPGDKLLPAGLLGPVEFVLRSSKINLKK